MKYIPRCYIIQCKYSKSIIILQEFVIEFSMDKCMKDLVLVDSMIDHPRGVDQYVA